MSVKQGGGCAGHGAGTHVSHCVCRDLLLKASVCPVYMSDQTGSRTVASSFLLFFSSAVAASSSRGL